MVRVEPPYKKMKGLVGVELPGAVGQVELSGTRSKRFVGVELLSVVGRDRNVGHKKLKIR